MNFDQLQQIWNSDDSEFEISINKEVINEYTAIKLQEGVKEIKWNSIIEITVTSLWLVFLIGFAIDHAQNFYFFIPAVLLIVVAIFSIILEAYKLKLFYAIRNQFSIVKAQHQIEKLNFLELLDIKLLHLIIPLFFVPFILVFAKGFMGIDLFELGLGIREIVMATIGSFLVAIVVAYLLKKFSLEHLKVSLDFLKEINELKKA